MVSPSGMIEIIAKRFLNFSFFIIHFSFSLSHRSALGARRVSRVLLQIRVCGSVGGLRGARGFAGGSSEGFSPLIFAPQGENKFQSFFPGACTSEKTLCAERVCERLTQSECANGARLSRSGAVRRLIAEKTQETVFTCPLRSKPSYPSETRQAQITCGCPAWR